MAVILSASLISNIQAQNPSPNNPRTAEEWIIGAINYLHSGGGGGGGDIMSDGSVPFTGQETFGAGLKTDTIAEKTAGAGVTIDGVLAKDGGIVAAAGAVGAPSYTFTGNLTDGFYSVSANQIGVAINGGTVAGFGSFGLFTNNINEQLVAAGITITSSLGVITLLPDAGWTAATGTIGKATFDADVVDGIINPTTNPDTQNFIRTLSGLYNLFIAKGFLTP